MEQLEREQHSYRPNSSFSPISIRQILRTCRNVSPHTVRQHFRASSEPSLIDRDCLRIINQRSPNKIEALLRSKGLVSNTTKPLKPRSYFKTKVRVFEDSYTREQQRFMRQTEEQYANREKLITKQGLFGGRKRPSDELQRSNIDYFERRFPETGRSLGRYRERMHPLCRLYESQAEKVMSCRLKVGGVLEQL